MVDINVGYVIPLSQFTLDKIHDVDLTKTIDEFKDLLTDKVNRPKNEFDICFAGTVLKNDGTLADAGIRENFMLHVIEKKRDGKEIVPEFPESDIKKLRNMLRFLQKKHVINHVFKRLASPDVLETILSKSPGLKDNVVAMTIFQRPELLSRMGGNMETVTRISKELPSLAYGVMNLLELFASIDFKAPVVPFSSSSSADTVFDQLVDDEIDTQSDVSMDSGRSQYSSNNTLDTVVPPPQNVAVVNPTMPSTSSASGSSARLSRSSQGITTEMLTQAVQRALNSSANTGQGNQETSSTPAPQVNYAPVTVTSEMHEKIQQLIGLGFVNEMHNFQALELTNGNVEEAVNILLSGALDD